MLRHVSPWPTVALVICSWLVARPLPVRGRRRHAASRADTERLSLAVDAGGLGTWDWDLRNNTVVWGGHHERVMGLTEGEFDGRYETFARTVHPDDLPGVDAALAHARDTRSIYHHEFRVIWPDGSTHWLAGRGRFLYDRHGRPIRMLGVIQDVTEQRNTIEQLRAANAERNQLLERLQMVMDQMPIGCVVTDLDLTMSYWNPAAERILGFSQAEVIGQSGYGIVIPLSARPFVEQMVAELISGVPTVVMVNENLTKDGRQLRCEWYNTALRNVAGATVGILAMFQDVTERERRDTEIRSLNVELEGLVAERTAELAAKNRELEVFTYSVSHDLKAPLRGLDGYSRLLQQDYAGQLGEEGRFFVEMIRTATRQMGTLIDDLLAYSRIERRSLHLRPVAVATIAAAVCAEFEAEFQSQNARLILSIPPGEAIGEPEGLAQALRNLIDNALKFSGGRPDSVIEVGASLDSGRFLIWVRDNGPGFAMEYHDRIFEIFQRLHRAEEYPGTGVGLAIVRKAMERLGGKVWAESAPGAGATFYLSLHIANQEP